MKAIGFNGGQFGDILMGTVAARAHKLAHPNSKLTLGLSEKYSAIAPLFANHEYFDDVHIWKGYNDWPAQDDQVHIALNRYDKVYMAMPHHTNPYWYLNDHQTAELCKMHKLTPPDNLNVSLRANWKIKREGRVALSLFGETRGGEKNCSTEQAKEIVQLFKELGYNTMQLGLPTEPDIGATYRFTGSFHDTVKELSNSYALITVDTAMSWFGSAFSVPTIGLYGFSYYPLAKTSVNWQPKNVNAIYVESPKVSDIIIDRIEAAYKSLIS